MEISLLCDCEDCQSTLIQLGCVNILCDIPIKLLNDFSESISESSNCNFSRGCDLYEKLNCSRIHIILITHSKGFQQLNLLNDFYDLSSTHIVCTRPVYVLSSIHYSRKGIKKGDVKSHCSLKGFGVGRLTSNLRERRYKREFSLLDFLNNNLLHLVSYNEPLTIVLTTTSAYTRHGPMVNALDSERLNDFAVQIRIVAMSSGYCLGSCNYLIKHENVSERIVYISKSSTLNRYTRAFDHSIFDNIGSEDVVIVTNSDESDIKTNRSVHGINDGNMGSGMNITTDTGRALSSNIKGSSGNGTGGDVGKGTAGSSANSANYTKTEVKKERKRSVDRDLFSYDTSSDASKSELEDEDEPLYELERLVTYCVNTVLKGHNVIVPLDFNYEYLIDVLESLNRTVNKMKKQVYVYCVGEGLEEMFDYLDKCCDWVSIQRSELTMSSEDPKSPFPDLDEMKHNNQFFYSDALSGISKVYREPSVLIMAVNSRRDFTDYLSNQNNRFLILQSKYYLYNSASGCSNSNGTTTTTNTSNDDNNNNSNYVYDNGNDNNYNDNNDITNANNINDDNDNNGKCNNYDNNSKCNNYDITNDNNINNCDITNDDSNENTVDMNNSASGSNILKERCVCASVNLQTNMSNINVNAKLVVLSNKNSYTKLHLDEANVGYIRSKLKADIFDKLKFSNLFAKPSLNVCGGDTSIGFNKFEVDCANINDVVLKPLQKGADTEQAQSSVSMTKTGSKTTKKTKAANQPKLEEREPEVSEQVNDLFLFGTYNHDKLVSELNKYFKEKIQSTRSREGITLIHNNFKLTTATDGKSTIIETNSDKYRKLILKSLQQVTLSI